MQKKYTLFRWIKKDLHYLLISFIAILIMSYTRTLIPLFSQHAVDTIINGDPSKLPSLFTTFINQGNTKLTEWFKLTDPKLIQLFYLGVALILFQMFRAIFIFLQGRSNGVFSENVAYKMRRKLYDHIQDLSYSYHTHAETGDLIQRSTSDVDTVRRFLGGQLPEVFRIVFLFTFAIIQMFVINVTLTFISIIIVPFIFAFAFIFFKRIQKVFTETDESEGKMTTALQENLTGIRVVKAFARENYEIEKFEKLSRKYSDNIQHIINSMAVYWSSSDLFIFFQIIATIVFGAYFTINGTITIGNFMAFTGLVNMVLWPVRHLGRVIVDFGKSSVSLKRISEVLEETDEYQEEGLLEPEVKGNIAFKNTSFQFDDANVPTLKNINLNIEKGETVAIIGKTGSGKSTLAHLLVRLYDYTDGSIEIDGVELKDIDKKWIRKNIGIILQEPFLFSRSIFENIGILDDNISEEKVYQAAQIASIHDDIQNFDKGYKTMIGERGVTLSGGQKQRVAIARMLVKDIPILIFDDSLSAVDTETDLSIRNALQSRSKDLTKIIITHRISTAMEADKIVVLEDGQILEMGTHDQLIDNNKVYKKIYDIQTSIESDFETTFNTKEGE